MDRKLAARLGSGLPLLTVGLLVLASAAPAIAQEVRNDGAPAQPDPKGNYALLDPRTAKLVRPMDVEASALSHRPPGKVQGEVKTLAGAKFSDVNLALCNAKTGDTLMTTTTDAEGYYAFSGVPEGRYVLYFPRQNVAAVVAVEADAQATALDVALEENPAPAPTATWVPDAVSNHPVLAAACGAVVIGGSVWAAAAISEANDPPHHAVVSPSSP